MLSFDTKKHFGVFEVLGSCEGSMIIQAVLTYYMVVGIGVACLFYRVYTLDPDREQTSSILLGVVLGLGALLWIVVLPLAYQELSSRSADVQYHPLPIQFRSRPIHHEIFRWLRRLGVILWPVTLPIAYLHLLIKQGKLSRPSTNTHRFAELPFERF